MSLADAVDHLAAIRNFTEMIADNMNVLVQEGGAGGLPGKGGGGAGFEELAEGAEGGEAGALAKGVDEIKKHFARAMGHAVAGATSRSAFQGIGHGLRGGAEIADLGPSPVAGGMLKFSAAIVESVEKLQNWNHELLQGSLQVGQYSGAMAAIQAQQEVFNIKQSQERGNRLAGSTKALADQSNRMDRWVSKIQDAWTNDMQNALASLLEVINPIAEGIADISEWVRGKKAEGGDNDMADTPRWMIEVNQTSWMDSYGRPARFDRAGTNPDGTAKK